MCSSVHDLQGSIFLPENPLPGESASAVTGKQLDQRAIVLPALMAGRIALRPVQPGLFRQSFMRISASRRRLFRLSAPKGGRTSQRKFACEGMGAKRESCQAEQGTLCGEWQCCGRRLPQITLRIVKNCLDASTDVLSMYRGAGPKGQSRVCAGTSVQRGTEHSRRMASTRW